MPASPAIESGWVARLHNDGYALLTGSDEAGLEAVREAFGPPLRTTHVRLDPRKGTYLTSPEAIPLHTDHPSIRWIAWLCVQQDEQDGTTLLSDLLGLSPEIAQAASRIQAPCPCLDSTRVRTTHPVLANGRWYYPEWHMQDLPESRTVCEAVASLPSLEVRLREGDVLVVDNHRVVHGRRALHPGSRRHLIRQWFPEAPANPGCQCVDEGATTRQPSRNPMHAGRR